MSKLPPELHPLGGGDNRPEPRDPQFVPDPECRESLAEATYELQLILDPDFLQSGARYPTFFYRQVRIGSRCAPQALGQDVLCAILG